MSLENCCLLTPQECNSFDKKEVQKKLSKIDRDLWSVEKDVLSGLFPFSEEKGGLGFSYQLENLNWGDGQILEVFISDTDVRIVIQTENIHKVTVNDFIIAKRVNVIYDDFRMRYPNIDWFCEVLVKDDWRKNS